MLRNKKDAGFVALTSVLIIGAVAVLIVAGTFSRSIGEMDRGLSREFSKEALSLANLCAERALYSLRLDPDYSGNERFVIGNGYCDILPLEGSWESQKIIKIEGKIEGEISSYAKRIKINVSSSEPKIIIADWREIANF